MVDEPQPTPPSFGNMSEHHWSRARRGANHEALEYYRQRSQAPGVDEGGAERNFYCMECDGVIPHEPAAKNCPHCGVAIEGGVKRYFNWVEMNDPPPSDLARFWPVLLLVPIALCTGAWFLLRWLFF
jgi:hypothetical protein